MTAIIVDDMPDARAVLTETLADVAPEVVVLAEAGNYADAVALLQTTTPDILFLDIDLGKHTGFDVLDALEQHSKMAVVFVTTYDEYALKAFKYAAVNYLLKPIVPDELSDTIDRIESKRPMFSGGQMSILKEQLLDVLATSGKQQFVQIRSYEGIAIIPAADVLYLQSEGSYTRVVKIDGTSMVASRQLNHYQKQLKHVPYMVRVHRSYIANMNEVKFISKKDNGMLHFKNDLSIPITNYEDIRNHFKIPE